MSDLHIITETQGDAEWFAARIGCLPASRIADAIAVRKKGNGDLQCRHDLKLELAVERVTNKVSEHFVSQWMVRGTELEPLARAAYELRTGSEVQQTGFILHPSINWAGCSPDGLVGSDGLMEIKVPKPTTHAEYLLGECVPELYQPQMLWQMACCPGREWNDFVSYCPDFPEPLDLFVCRLLRNNARIAEMEAEAIKFLAEVDATVSQLKGGLEVLLQQSIASVVPKAVIPR